MKNRHILQHQAPVGLAHFQLQRQFKGAKQPAPTKPIPPVTSSSVEVAQAETQAKRDKAKRQGYSSTLLGAGDTGGTQDQPKTLLG